jgi:hypothetical protein
MKDSDKADNCKEPLDHKIIVQGNGLIRQPIEGLPLGVEVEKCDLVK